MGGKELIAGPFTFAVSSPCVTLQFFYQLFKTGLKEQRLLVFFWVRVVLFVQFLEKILQFF